MDDPHLPDKRPRKNLHHYNTPGHAHELTFSCYRRQPLLEDPVACRMLLDELNRSRQIYSFKLWAYVLMPHHVHLLIWPMNSKYDIGKIDSGIKGVMSKRYRKHLLENDRARHDCIVAAGQDADGFVFWQKGGGFDRNMWNSTAIHNSVRYIEANPVRSRLVDIAEEWPWSSAYARARPSAEVVMPDAFSMPVALPDPQFQSVGRM